MRKIKGGKSGDAFDPQLLQNMQNQRLVDDFYNSLNVNCSSNKSDDTALQNSSGASLQNDNIEGVNYLYMQNIRGGYKKYMGSNNNMNASLAGGCLTCPKGKKKLKVYFNNLVVLMPKLYKDYAGSRGSKSLSTRPLAKKVKKVTKVAKVTKVTKVTKVARASPRPVAVVKRVARAARASPRPVAVVKRVAKPTAKAVKRPVAKRPSSKKKVRGGNLSYSNITNTSWLSFKQEQYTPENLGNQIASLESRIF
jgi:hypothetical protein